MMKRKGSGKTQTLRQRYTTAFLPLITGLMLLSMIGVMVYSVQDLSRENREIRRIINDVVAINLDVVQDVNGIYDYLFGKDIEEKLRTLKEEFAKAGNSPVKMNLEFLKEAWGDRWDLYIIDSDETIIATTYPPDLGMNFHVFADFFANRLKEIRETGGLTLDKIALESAGNGYRKFGYLPTDDRRYILEVGLRIPINDPLFRPIDPDYVGALYSSVDRESIAIEVFPMAALLDASNEAEAVAAPVRREMLRSGERYREEWNWSEGTVTTYLNYDKRTESRYPTSEEYFVVTKFSLAAFKADIIRVVALQSLQLLVVLLLGMIILRRVSRSLAGPIHDMVDDISMIAEGNWGHRIGSAGSEEFLTLKSSVENLVGALMEEKEAAESRRRTIEDLAYSNKISGMPNLHAFYEDWSGGDHRPTALVLVNLDDFSRVNTAFGHDIGDDVIRAFCLSMSEFLVRKEGGTDWHMYHVHTDELLLVTSGNDEARAEAAIRKLFEELSTGLFLTLDKDFFFTVSMGGIVCTSERADTMPETFRKADIALARAKEGGKNGLVFFEEDLSADYRNTYALVHDIWEGLHANSLKLVYQPIVDIRQKNPVGFEALLRIGPDPAVSPLAAIKVAEDSGLIHPLGIWIIGQALQQAKEFEESGVDYRYISINISPLQFREQGLPARIADMCRRSGVEPGRIQLEITETALMQSEARMVSVIHELKSLGFRIAMDDFGTGYSSLAYLARLPIDVIKIEKYMTSEVFRDPKVRSVVSLIMEIARELRLDVIAEGIESDEHARWMEEQDCLNHQGYYYSPPLDSDRIAPWLKNFHQTGKGSG